eukprot:TRINITY_DN8451_c0_g1_i2.p1 TRINITY_DN8451_c0_g1~~TRINITY_DN8451_c0_g1_i2.p1  ORF type:complete len:226 (-),score=103.65 TRINITY_DN8451_c0_g1_i2:344-1021(-)
MCIRDRYQRRVHGELSKKKNKSRSMRVFIIALAFLALTYLCSGRIFRGNNEEGTLMSRVYAEVIDYPSVSLMIQREKKAKGSASTEGTKTKKAKKAKTTETPAENTEDSTTSENTEDAAPADDTENTNADVPADNAEETEHIDPAHCELAKKAFHEWTKSNPTHPVTEKNYHLDCTHMNTETVSADDDDDDTLRYRITVDCVSDRTGNRKLFRAHVVTTSWSLQM